MKKIKMLNGLMALIMSAAIPVYADTPAPAAPPSSTNAPEVQVGEPPKPAPAAPPVVAPAAPPAGMGMGDTPAISATGTGNQNITETIHADGVMPDKPKPDPDEVGIQSTSHTFQPQYPGPAAPTPTVHNAAAGEALNNVLPGDSILLNGFGGPLLVTSVQLDPQFNPTGIIDVTGGTVDASTGNFTSTVTVNGELSQAQVQAIQVGHTLRVNINGILTTVHVTGPHTMDTNGNFIIHVQNGTVNATTGAYTPNPQPNVRDERKTTDEERAQLLEGLNPPINAQNGLTKDQLSGLSAGSGIIVKVDGKDVTLTVVTSRPVYADGMPTGEYTVTVLGGGTVIINGTSAVYTPKP